MKMLQRYWGLMSVQIKKAMVYRFSLVISFVADVVKTIVMLTVWVAVFRQQIIFDGFDYSMMITYLLISQTLNNIYGFHNAAERLIASKIIKGTIGFDLLQPVRFTTARLAENLGQTVIQVAFAVLMFLGFKMTVCEFAVPSSGSHAIFFLVSASIGFFIMFAVSLLSGLLSFWTMSSWGVRNAKNAIVSFFSGAVVPIDLLPGWLQNVMNVLPFKNIIYVPTFIYMGKYTAQEMMTNIVMQLCWAVGLWLLVNFLFNMAIRKVSINGG